MNLVEVVSNLHLYRSRQVPFDFRQQCPNTRDQRQGIAGRRCLHADEHGVLAVHLDTRGPALGIQIDAADVLHPHDCAVLRLYHHLVELLDVGEPRIGVDIGNGEVAFGLARRRLKVIGADRGGDVAGRNPPRRHPCRVEPQPHRKGLPAENVSRCDAINRGEQRLHDAGQIIGDRRARQFRAGEADIHDRRSLSCRFGDDRVLQFFRKLEFDLLDLGHDVGERLARIVIETDIGRDRAGSLNRRRGQVIDALGGRHRLRDRRRDKALHQIGRSAGVERRDCDRRVRQLRVLADLQAGHRLETDQQDQQADHQRQHRPADEDVGKGHISVPRQRFRRLWWR